MRRLLATWGLVAVVCGALACGSDGPKAGVGSAAPSASGSAPAGPGTPKAADARTYEGSAVARDAAERFVVVADEDHAQLRVVDLPLGEKSTPRSLEMPGPPAQLVMMGSRLFVTIRNPSMLIAYDLGEGIDPAAWKEAFKTELPNDAWGLAVDTATQSAYVSSAWGRSVSRVSLEDGKKRWSAPVAREPRGLLARGDMLFVSHLVGSEITRISALVGETPKVERRKLWPAPLRTPIGSTPSAALGYALAASPDGRRLFVPRHAIGVLGEWSWYGAATVDVFNIALDKPVLDEPKHRRVTNAADFPGNDFVSDMESYWGAISRNPPSTVVKGGPVAMTATMGRQPRHAVYRASTNTLLIASEGQNQLVEYDAVGPAPGLSPVFTYNLGHEAKPVLEYPTRSGAPTGIALSKDESIAYVYCRSTDDLVAQKLQVERFKSGGDTTSHLGLPTIVRLVDETAHADPKDKRVELFQVGRAAFYQADSHKLGEGAACATCHPDGRDDGFVWTETHELRNKGKEYPRLVADIRLTQARLAGGWQRSEEKVGEEIGRARQTPMLAGRVAHAGPFGWTGESEKLEDRVTAGMVLHRSIDSSAEWSDSTNPTRNYVGAGLARFLREGLRPPARDERPLTKLEEEGRTLFLSTKVGCASCHVPKTHYTDGTGYPKIVGKNKRFMHEPKQTFRTPPLAHVSGTEPFLHDGSRSSLDSLLRFNNDKMGKTNHLTDDQRKALVAFLETL